ncbi:uncharacterized protein IL334_004116 [Kwoniella shivajii]|uniref:Uncharacterized protein n=1 Tax=Kwoniella shivajii TaxID=564305 RepID=A0ABZ1CZF6_9TREE|nr:hypothetical protein IL334_004116 [Kwoniella shivajii]
MEIQPKNNENGMSAERWALMQKTPQVGDWFTSAVDARQVEKRKGTDLSLLERLAEGASFVTIPQGSSTTFTASFGPTFDSYEATGGQGYYSAVEGMHEHARHNEWSNRVLGKSKHIEEGGYFGVVDSGKGKSKETVDDILAENGALIAELQAWQEVRINKGVPTVTEREQQVAEELLTSLTKITGTLSPAKMLSASTSRAGLAHELARRFLPVNLPSIRGTLDPRRPNALHDNITVKPRTMAGQTLGGTTNPAISSPHAPPPPVKTGIMQPPPVPGHNPPPPHTLPAAARQSNSYRANTTPNRGSYPYTPTPTIPIHTNNNRTPASPSGPASPGTASALFPRSAVGPGPSNLRQSFGPGTPGSNGAAYGMNVAGSRGMMMSGAMR